MTTWVCQRRSGLSASVPGIRLTTGHQGRLSVKVWLSRPGFSPLLALASSDKAAPNRNFVKAYRYQTKTPEAEDQGDANQGAVATYRPSKAASNGRIRGGAKHILRICRAIRGQVYFIKVCIAQEEQDRRGPTLHHGHYKACCRAAEPTM
jgi:hypothetical protein